MNYEVLYADPPWDYAGRTQQNGTSETGGAVTHYPTMSLEQLKALRVPDICAKNAALFLWTSSPHLPQAIALMEAWGFTYKTVAFCWDKQKINPGYYTMSQVELVLVGTKGLIPKPRGSRNERQFFSEKRTVHSKKPDEIRKRIFNMFPTQKKIELFARQASDGWDVFGNQVEGSIQLPA
jgi:N6-adenosine-specific RNA methylase IME4